MILASRDPYATCILVPDELPVPISQPTVHLFAGQYPADGYVGDIYLTSISSYPLPLESDMVPCLFLLYVYENHITFKGGG